MSAPMQDRDWLTVAYLRCSPAAKARASRDLDELEIEPTRCPRCLHYLTDEARCGECGQHAHE